MCWFWALLIVPVSVLTCEWCCPAHNGLQDHWSAAEHVAERQMIVRRLQVNNSTPFTSTMNCASAADCQQHQQEHRVSRRSRAACTLQLPHVPAWSRQLAHACVHKSLCFVLAA
jgi:hypothetical protein